MSKAGIQSNRGDGFQTLVAFDWALTVLTNPAFQWLEIDSTAFSVDDVVVGKTEGAIVCCQCKKNHALHKSWSLADLSEEIEKAKCLLAINANATVRFYSRSAFGDISALRENSANYGDELAFSSSLSIAQKKINVEFERIGKNPSDISFYQFLTRTSFEVCPDLDRMSDLLKERLRQLVSNPSAAFNALWTRLDQLGMRTSESEINSSSQHRITKNELKELLAKAGSMLVPAMDMAEVQASFKSISAIGRSWSRDIRGYRISSPAVEAVVGAIEKRHESILLTGLPGSGKTCVLLDVQEKLEAVAQTRSDLIPLFIQSREFADAVSANERQALGLSEHWIERVARMAEAAHVVVLIDSLDVLSIARERSILTYFLAQIDRILLIPNVTVVTACREFDFHYERRISQREWKMKITCQPLDWGANVAPLLENLKIDSSLIDATTHELIRNPRELALFVELAEQIGSFNVVTSQALAQRYLSKIVEADSALGDIAMHAIEAMAAEMLRLRSLSVPYQRFTASQQTKRTLLSNKILHETSDQRLTFGHQTLLDVLVINGAIRNAVTLGRFIDGLPAVPFVRPSIRSFVSQLELGDRRNFRKQLRAVLTGNFAFHIRRLVAETFAERPPNDEDWFLLRDLRTHHHDIFQVIYLNAVGVEWHYFWIKNLIPVLKERCDVDGLAAHSGMISRWKNEDPAGVFRYWAEMLVMENFEKLRLIYPLANAVREVQEEHLSFCAPLLAELLKLPRQRHSFLGSALARCVESGCADDGQLWAYVANDVEEGDLLGYELDKKLYCMPHEFGSGASKFFSNRMCASTTLLDLAISSIQEWSQVKNSKYKKQSLAFWSGFLDKTSHSDAHTEIDIRHISSERVLFDAVEAAVVQHAITHSVWWQENSDTLFFSEEGALRYFAIKACLVAPDKNIHQIGRMCCDEGLLTSGLSYEIGTLLQANFLNMDESTQTSIQAMILNLRAEMPAQQQNDFWVLMEKAQLLLAIPCHFRVSRSLSILKKCEEYIWPLMRVPSIGMRGGMVHSPISAEVFLDSSDSAVMCLLKHYANYQVHGYDAFMMGGAREVGAQLAQAASCQASRFLRILNDKFEEISNDFRDDIVEGIAAYIGYRHGELRPSNPWIPREEPDGEKLAEQLLCHLYKNGVYWRHSRSASKAIQSCSHIILNEKHVLRLIRLSQDFSTLDEESSVSGASLDLLTIGINMARGNAVEALMILGIRLANAKEIWPGSLSSALLSFAQDKNPAIRALMLRRMPNLQDLKPEFGWKLFELLTLKDSLGLWAIAEPCFYYAYHQKFELVEPFLKRIIEEGDSKDLVAWGRISALCVLSHKISISHFLLALKTSGSPEAWRGAASVWAHAKNVRQHAGECFLGLQEGLSSNNRHANMVASELHHLFEKSASPLVIPLEIIRKGLDLLSTESDIFGFDAWLNSTSLHDPAYALDAAEIYIDFVRRKKPHFYDHENNLTQLLTCLFAQAEEQEEVDSGAMLQRVCSIQDALLALGVNGVNEWLRAAERP